MLLRIVVGYHFFKEGTSKLHNGFSSRSFLASAKGPLAPTFKRMLDDPDGMQKLCVVQSKATDGTATFDVDPAETFMMWNEFLDETTDYYGFGSKQLQDTIAERRDRWAEKIRTAREQKLASVDTAELESERELDRQNILRIREQPERRESILKAHQQLLKDWIAATRVELIAHFSSADRLDGFQQDGAERTIAAMYVDSIRGQVDSIRSDRKEKLAQWTAEVTSIWDSLENQINQLAVDGQAGRPAYSMFRPFDQETSYEKTIDRVIPWFDTIVGGLLILGLFSRLASLAAASFLVSVILTQPPWIPGTAPTYFYFIELMALLVIFATCAGRMGGLDYFLSFSRRSQPESETTS